MTSNIAEILQQRGEMRMRNLNPTPQRNAFTTKNASLKSDLKKATSLAKRFKNYSAESSEKFILTQLDSVSFGMFLSEAAQGVVQSLCFGTKTKVNDAHSLTIICSEVHQRYEGFWPLVRKGLKDNAGQILDLEVIKNAMERMEESATVVPTTNNNNNNNNNNEKEGGITNTISTSSGITGTSNSITISSRSPTEEFNRLRLIAKVFCEWWLVGLLDDAKPLLNVLKLLHNLLEKRAETSSSPLAITTVLSITNLIIREVGIELLGTSNEAISWIFEKGEEKGIERLRESIGKCGNFIINKSSEIVNNKLVFLIGPIGAKLIFNTSTKSIGSLESTTLQQAEEASWVRLNKIYHLQNTNYSKNEEQKQFSTILISYVKTCTKAYERRKEKIEGWWQTICKQAELRGKTVPQLMEEPQFQLFQEHLERYYVVCENFLGMLGFLPPPTVDLSIVEQKTTSEITITPVVKKFYTVIGAETLNRFENDEKRIFYEYIPDIQSLSQDFLLTLTSEVANWDLILKRRAMRYAISPGTGKSIEESDYEEEEEEEIDYIELSKNLEIKDENKDQINKETIAMIERRRLRLAELAVPAALFEEYEPILKLLEELDHYITSSNVDQWCEQFAKEALRPMHNSNDNIVAAKLFFLNCRILLTLELRHYPRVRYSDKLPFISRIAAIWHQYFPDMGEFLGKRLEIQWKRECKNYASNIMEASNNELNIINIQQRLASTVRYLCELMKFGISSTEKVLNIFKSAIENLENSWSYIVIRSALEHGGLFLLRNHRTKISMEKIISKLKKEMQHTVLGEKEYMMINNGLKFLKPPITNQNSRFQHIPQEEKTLLERYTLYLLHEVLSIKTYNFVLSQLLKMPWNDTTTSDMLIRNLREVHQMSWDTIPLIANLLADLIQAGKEKNVQYIVDEIAEDLRRDLELNNIKSEILVEGSELYPSLTSKLHLSYRPLQWRIVDCFFITNLCRVRVLSFRFIGYIILLQLFYIPHNLSSYNDYSRLRCCITLLAECISFLPWRLVGRTTRSLERLASLHQLIRIFMSYIFIHRYSLQEPLPLDLRHRLEDLTEKLDKCMRLEGDDDKKKYEIRLLQMYQLKKYNKHRKEEEEEEEEGEEKNENNTSIENMIPSLGIKLPETLEEANTYAKSVSEELIYSANIWYKKVSEAMKLSCRDDAPYYRIFSLNVNEKSLESTMVKSDVMNAKQKSLEIFPEEVELADDIASSHGSELEENRFIPRSETSKSNINDDTSDNTSESSSESDSNSSSSSSSSSSRDSSISDDENSESDESISSESNTSSDTSDDENDDEENFDASSTFTGPATLATYEDEEEREEEIEEEEREEEIEEEEREEEIEEDKFAAMERLRLRLEEANLDAELRALMSENPREAASRINLKGSGAERGLEHELAMGLRLHRQQQRQVGPPSLVLHEEYEKERNKKDTHEEEVEEKEKEKIQEMKFTLLLRPTHSTSNVGKTGGAAVSGVKVASNIKSATLSIPRESEFAQSALMLQEQQRRQQEELREITRSINRMQEAENQSGKKSKNKDN